MGRPSLAAAGGEVVGESVDSGVAEGVDSFVAVEDTVGLGVKACVGSSGDLSAGGEGEEGVDSGVAVGESEGLGGGGGGRGRRYPGWRFFLATCKKETCQRHENERVRLHPKNIDARLLAIFKGEGGREFRIQESEFRIADLRELRTQSGQCQ